MNTVIIHEGQRGIETRRGRVARILQPGRHRVWAWLTGARVEIIDVRNLATAARPELERVVAASDGDILDVADGTVALLAFQGHAVRVLGAGRWILWHGQGEITATVVSLAPLRSQIPALYWAIAGNLVTEVLVRPHERVLVYADGVLEEVLGAGRHGLSPWQRRLELVRHDLREQQLQIAGQELIAADKATLRLSVLLKYAIVDPVVTVQAVTDLNEALYAEVQMATRQAVAGATIDALLERRVEIAREMTGAVAQRVAAWGIEVRRLELKDVILPGELKDLMNRVIEAEKRAAAQVILRREEVAATRSLANTARLLESNPVLLRLKETEAIKEIAEKIANLTVVVAPKDMQDLLRLGVRSES